MQVANGGAGFGFTFIGLPEDVEYYVEAGGIKSSSFKLHTVDLPGVKNIAVTYNYPSWSGIPSNTENPGGDLRAVEGTTAHLDIETDRPLSDGQIVFEEGNPLKLDATKVDATKANKTAASVTIAKDGMYHVGVEYQGEVVRISDDYFIEARKVTPPTLRISKPGRDAKVSPIEEVGVQVSAEDEYPLQELSLHYSVNGGEEKTISLLKDKGTKKVEGTSMLSGGRFWQGCPGRYRQSLCGGPRWQEHPEDGHDVRPGGAVRIQLHAVAAGRRRRRWWWRTAAGHPDFRTRKGNHCRDI